MTAPHFSACNSYRPQRLNAPFVGAGHIIMIGGSDKRDLKSLGAMRARVKEARGNHYVLHVIALLQRARTFVSYKIQT